MAFPESFLDELIARNDIAEVVGGYVQFTKRSGSNLFGLCPFHNEKTPSFSVSPEKQIYHCFGCGKGGGVINFIMEIENLNFPDAVEFLARRCGMTVPEDNEPAQQRGKRERLLELNKAAARFFYENLSKPEGKTALEYINKREISKAMVKRFGLGVAFDSWNSLTDAMTAKGFSRQELLDAGLAKMSRKGSGAIYDTFRNRLMFPVIDVRGSVIAFSGRILGDGEPKYLNSPDTPVFNKSRNLFALNLAKKSKAGMIILAEGNVDVVSLHQAGFDCAVASLGTSLTQEQVKLISRYTENVVLAYDADAAGIKASQRAISLFENTGINVKVLRIPDGKDPDEFIKKHGSDSFRVLLEKSENHIDYRIMTIKGKYDLNTDEGRIGFLSESAQMLSGLSSPVEREVYGARIAQDAGVAVEAVQLEIKKAFKKRVKQQQKQTERREMRVENAIQPADRTLKYENVRSAAAEEGVIRLLLLDAGLIDNVGDLKSEEFSSPFLGELYEKICTKIRSHENVTAASLAAVLSPAEAAQLTVIIGKPEVLSEAEKSMADYIEKIRTENIRANAAKNLLAVSEKYRKTKGYGESNE